MPDLFRFLIPYFLLAYLTFGTGCKADQPVLPPPEKGSRIVLIGNNLCARMLVFGHFETAIQSQFPDSNLVIRNLCDGGNTVGFRPHPGRESPWAFPGAKAFYDELAFNSGSEGHFESPDQWLTRLQADIILAFFGYNESFNGEAGVADFKAELQAFIQHTLQQNYNSESPLQLILIAPTAFEDLSDQFDLPNGVQTNKNLALYTQVMREVAKENGVPFVDLFRITKTWFVDQPHSTQDGFQLTDKGYKRLCQYLATTLFGRTIDPDTGLYERIRSAVLEKNWFWQNDFKIPNGVHVYGRRYDPFGPANYPYELQKIRKMTRVRDSAIWATAQGRPYAVDQADQFTGTLPPVETNYDPEEHGRLTYLQEQEALSSLHTAPGYRVELFAAEKAFPDLANPAQLSFDAAGRLWVSVMPSYPHYKPGDPRPNDKILILEDTDGDGKADKQTTFLDSIHLPIGFELAPEGVYVSQGSHLKLYTDTDGDDRADREEVLLSGFDDHDTHHAISAFCADPSGAIYMGEGVFLHSNVETPYGPVRATNGGFFRYDPQKRKLERTAQIEIPNPWGIAFDKWGQPFFLETSGPAMRWMLPSTTRPFYGSGGPLSFNLIEPEQQVRPTSGLEFVSSRHFPEEVQGDLLLGNTIGFLGIKQHAVQDSGTGYHTEFRQDLLWSDDPNFRPVDLEFAPDGSLYVVDWHNILIGHMQHNARDPLRDHVHGRIYRITYPELPLVSFINLEKADVPTLLDALKAPEYRTRYRARRVLRGRPTDQVRAALDVWVSSLDPNNSNYEYLLLEALWVSWGLNAVDSDLLDLVLGATDFRVRAAGVRVIRYTTDQLPDAFVRLKKLAGDKQGRVRLEAIVAASWLDPKQGMAILDVAEQQPLDEWMIPTLEAAKARLKGERILEKKEVPIPGHLKGEAAELFDIGQWVYQQDGYCGTCHQSNGMGLPAAGFPPLANSDWVRGDKERLIRLTLHGLQGPIEVNGETYPGRVPMTGFGGLLEDDEVAGVLTFIRNSFGNQASPVKPEEVGRVRSATRNQSGYYSPSQLLELYPWTATSAK